MQLRNEVLNRDGFQCVECGSRHNLEIDHNLRVLCTKCYDIFHHKENPELHANSGKTNIILNTNTHERLKTYGIYGDSFSSIINRLMDEVDEYRRLKSKK